MWVGIIFRTQELYIFLRAAAVDDGFRCGSHKFRLERCAQRGQLRHNVQVDIESFQRACKTGDAGEYVEISIKDTGIGIPKDEQSNIFKRFYRDKNAVSTIAAGSGLGLFIAKSIIERHGGKLWFESEHRKGTTFYFTLPTTQYGNK